MLLTQTANILPCARVYVQSVQNVDSMHTKETGIQIICRLKCSEQRLPVRAILYGGKRLPFRAPRAKPAPNATQIAPTTANPMYNGQSEPATK